MQKDTIVKISSILHCRKIPEGIRIRLQITFYPTGNSKKPILLNRKPLKKRKIEKKIFGIFLLKNVFGKSPSAENPKKETLWDFLASILLQNIEKIEGGPPRRH